MAERVSDEAVRSRTGRGWAEWFELLDGEGALEMPHGEIAALLRGKYGVGGWWAQNVTVGYEQERGLRAKHQKPSGYEISVSRTLPRPGSRRRTAPGSIPDSAGSSPGRNG